MSAVTGCKVSKCAVLRESVFAFAPTSATLPGGCTVTACARVTSLTEVIWWRGLESSTPGPGGEYLAGVVPDTQKASMDHGVW